MKFYRVIGLLVLIISVSVNALAAVDNQNSLADPFSMDGRDIITAPEHLGIINGKLTIGTPAGQAVARIKGLWAPPYVSSDYVLNVEIFGKELASPTYKWWPYKIEQQSEVKGVKVSAATVLVPGKRAGLIAISLHNITLYALEVPLAFKTYGRLDCRDYWGFGAAQSSTDTKAAVEKNTLTLTADKLSIIQQGAGAGDALVWDDSSRIGTQSLSLQPGGTAMVYLVFAIGPTAEASAECKAIADNPVKAIADADATYSREVADMFQRIPRLVSNNKDIEKFYNRSLVPFITNRWDVPEFVLHPYYSTGSIRGGCICNYLWNYGEIWQIMPLYDPAATREHIKQFLKCDMTVHYAFNPIDGNGFGPRYPVNQEKIIGLVYNYVKITGDKAFLNEVVDGNKTTLENILKIATYLEDILKPAEMIDYGPANDHLELRRQYTYNHVMPDLNGRRYASYLRAAELAEIAGKPAPYLCERAATLKMLLKQKLWNPETRWFDFINGKGQHETRWTVQMFYLIGSGVLDNEMETSLISHLNEKEFLSQYGLHSLAKNDPAYDEEDIDNGGPGCCPCFPANIANFLQKAGQPSQAEDIIRRCIWWGSKLPYWGDSLVADRADYRRDTPLQCVIDGVTVAQYFIFGMFGVDPQFDGSILVSPRPTAFSSQTALRGVKIQDIVFDIEVSGNEFKVTSDSKTVAATVGRTVSIKKKDASTELRVMDNKRKN